MHENNEAYVKLLEVSRWPRTRVAKELGVAHSTVMRWERAEIIPEVSKLRLFAELAGLPLQIGSRTLGPSHVDEGEVSNAVLEKRILKGLHRLSPTKQRFILGALEQIIEAASPEARYSKSSDAPENFGKGEESAHKPRKVSVAADVLVGSDASNNVESVQKSGQSTHSARNR